MLDEAALRKEEWADGERIRRGDGQEWTFPRPMLREFRPTFSADGGANFPQTPFITFRPGYLLLLDELIASDKLARQIELIATMAAELLRRNYSLDDESLGKLLCFVHDEARDQEDGKQEETNQEMWQALANVVSGMSSKNPTSDG